MKMTSAQAAKELRKLNDQHGTMLTMEKKSCVYTVAIQEDAEKVKPDYDYTGTQAGLQELEDKIRKLKHSINTFNLTTEVPGFGMTIDQMLIYIPQLTAQKNKLDSMRKRLKRERKDDPYDRSNIVEYDYANYDIKAAVEDYQKVSDELAEAQNALDTVNTTIEYDFDI